MKKKALIISLYVAAVAIVALIVFFSIPPKDNIVYYPLENGEGLVEHDESLTLESCQRLRLLPLDKNVGKIENAEQAIEKARSLWESETEYMGEKFYSPEIYPDIAINYDAQEDCWIIVGTHFVEKSGDEAIVPFIELLPISIIKSTGEVLHNGVID